MALTVDAEFVQMMSPDERSLFIEIQNKLTTMERIFDAHLPANEYRQVALDSLKLAIVSVAECLTEEA